jgi:hypothetical protein
MCGGNFLKYEINNNHTTLLICLYIKKPPTMLTLSLFCAFFIYMLDYGLGHPADEKVGYGSFLFGYSFWLAKRAMGVMYPPIELQYRAQLADATSALERQQIKRSFQEIVFTQGRQLFTWQKAFGMCPFCTHFWFTVIAFLLAENIFYFQDNIIIFSFYFTLSHVIIRFLKKWI